MSYSRSGGAGQRRGQHDVRGMPTLGGRFSKRTEGARFLLAVSLGRDCCRQAGSELGLLAMRRLAAASFHYPHFSVCSTVKMHLLMHLQAGGMAVRTFLACCGLFLGAPDPR
jgi:hypothetical protein